MPGARITDQLCASEVHQAGFSYDFYYPLVPRVQNDAYIANEIATDFKTEFFNSVGRLQPPVEAKKRLLERATINDGPPI